MPQNKHKTGFRGPSPDVGKPTRWKQPQPILGTLADMMPRTSHLAIDLMRIGSLGSYVGRMRRLRGRLRGERCDVPHFVLGAKNAPIHARTKTVRLSYRSYVYFQFGKGGDGISRIPRTREGIRCLAIRGGSSASPHHGAQTKNPRLFSGLNLGLQPAPTGESS